MKTFIIASEKSWHKELFESLCVNLNNYNWILIDKNEEFTFDIIKDLNPEKIFLPHWSYIIPSTIYDNFDCVVFHMTDLPFGRGGSPLQNLIVRGLTQTKISAIKVNKGIDTGGVYLKRDLDLYGTAKEIFIRSSPVIGEMIEEVIIDNLEPQDQTGEVVEFKRRKPEESNIISLVNTDEVYDYIRMLDCEGYPHAFIEIQNFRFEFTNASLISDKEIIANVRIIKK